PDPYATDFTDGVRAYLQKRGDLCIARTAWPVDVTEADRAQRTRDALQMPVMEKLGLVQSSPATVRVDGEGGPALVPATRYRLTDRGRRFYLARPPRLPAAPGDPGGDFCVAKISLVKVTGWELSPNDAHPASAAVSYTYEVDAPGWMRDP